jgi:nucleolar pre-ribosomal-associated protein 1
LFAFLDTWSSETGTGRLPEPESDVWKRQLARLAKTVVDESVSPESRATAGSCVSLLLKLVPARMEEFVAVVLDRLRTLPVTSLTAEILVIGRRLHATNSSHGKSLLTALADHGIQWAVRCFAEDLDGSSDGIIEELST